MTDLNHTFDAQADFQRYINTHPEMIEDPEELINYILVMKTALESELNEMLQEIGWKPWATSRHINWDAARSELVDSFQFFMNLCFAFKLRADDLVVLHQAKLVKNYARADRGYDGVSEKCAWCGRALDDAFVSCETKVEGTRLGWCFEKNENDPIDRDGFFTQEDLQERKK